jgi:hypothetical protein
MPTGPATKLKIRQQPSGTVISGTVFPRQPIVETDDAHGHPVKVAGTNITVALVEVGPTLAGTLTVATDATGKAHFTDLKITGTAGPYHLVFTSSGLTSATSAKINLIAGPAATLTSLVVSPSSVTLDHSTDQQFSVAATWSDGSHTAVTPTWHTTTGSIDSSGLLTSGTVDGTFAVTATSGSIVGTATVIVATAPAPIVTPSLTAVLSGGNVTVTWAGVQNPSTFDYVQLWTTGVGASDTSTFAYTSSGTTTPGLTASTAGSCVIVMPTTAGDYVFKLFYANTDTVIAVSQVVTVASVASPTLAFAGNPLSVNSGQSVVLQWNTTNATSCTASVGWTGTKPVSGSATVTPTITTTYTLTATGPGGTTAPQSVAVTVVVPTVTPIPQLDLWRQKMLTYGASQAAYLAANKNTDLGTMLTAVYYDGTQVFSQIRAYTGDSTWDQAIQDAAFIYRDRYALAQATPGNVAGYENFTTGLRMEGSDTSKNAVILISQNAAFCPDTTPVSWTDPVAYSRECAYCIRAYIEAEACGAARRARRAAMVTQAYGHVAQFQDQSIWGTQQIAPFMMALTSYALIRDWQQTHDTRCIPALEALWDFTWPLAWVDTAQAMQYSINPGDTRIQAHDPAPDLNNLICYPFGFLWQQTGLTRFRDRGDLLFAGAALYGYWTGHKQFDQLLQFSFDYVTMRQSRA